MTKSPVLRLRKYRGFRLIIHNNLFQSQALLMLDRFPFYLGEQGYDIDRYVSQHEDREGKCVQDLLSGAAMDLFPFADGSNNTKNKYGQAEAYEHLQQGMTQDSEGSIRSECVKGSTQIYQNADRG